MIEYNIYTSYVMRNFKHVEKTVKAESLEDAVKKIMLIKSSKEYLDCNIVIFKVTKGESQFSDSVSEVLLTLSNKGWF